MVCATTPAPTFGLTFGKKCLSKAQTQNYKKNLNRANKKNHNKASVFVLSFMFRSVTSEAGSTPWSLCLSRDSREGRNDLVLSLNKINGGGKSNFLCNRTVHAQGQPKGPPGTSSNACCVREPEFRRDASVWNTQDLSHAEDISSAPKATVRLQWVKETWSKLGRPKPASGTIKSGLSPWLDL